TLYYALPGKPSADVVIDVLDGSGNVVRHLTSAPAAPVREAARPPMENFWIAAPSALSTNVGLNRAIWDLRYDPPPAFAHTFGFNGNPGLTRPSPEGPLALPGSYRVRLTVDGRRYAQTVTVRTDPRSRVTRATLIAQHRLLMRLYSGLQATWANFKPVVELRAHVATIAPDDTVSEVGKAARALATTLDSIAGDSLEDVRQPWDARPAAWTFVGLNREFAIQLTIQDNADHAPTRAAVGLARSNCADVDTMVARWRRFLEKDLTTFNSLLVRNGKTRLAAAIGRMQRCSV
ncbi:MAG: hypothetical protein ABR537_00490, partial [Gemmatimonadales bacterium]